MARNIMYDVKIVSEKDADGNRSETAKTCTQDEIAFWLKIVYPATIDGWMFAIKLLARKQSVDIRFKIDGIMQTLTITRH